MKKFIKFAFVAAIAAVAGYNVYQSQSVMNGMSDFALANVEALANDEYSDRPDCEIAYGECSILVVYPDGVWGEDIVYGKKKKIGWV